MMTHPLTDQHPLSDLKPGDKVILRYCSPFVPDEVATVDRITKTQIIVGKRRFRISDGRELSDGLGNYFRIVPATPSAIAEAERQQQNEKDQKRAHQLVLAIDAKVSARDFPNAAAAIPHLEAALAAINQK